MDVSSPKIEVITDNRVSMFPTKYFSYFLHKGVQLDNFIYKRG